MYIHPHTHTHTDTQTHICIYIYSIHIYAHTHTHTHMHVYTYIYMRAGREPGLTRQSATHMYVYKGVGSSFAEIVVTNSDR
jgi:hypothetical protein